MKIIGPTVFRKPFKYRGKISSADVNDFNDAVVNDVTQLCAAVNSNYGRLAEQMTIMQSELEAMRGKVAELDYQRVYSAQIAGYMSTYFTYYTDFRSSLDLVWDDAIKVTSRGSSNARFGELTLPMRNVQERFFTYALDNGAVVSPSNLNVQVTSQFTKDGETKDWEYGGTITPGSPESAFAGHTNDFWVRRVEFPLDSDVAEVECEVVALIPRRASSYSNLLEVVPFPNSQTDLTYVGICPDLSDTYTTLATDENSTLPTRYHYTPVITNKLKIRLRQRHWVEENGKKVFYYGLREVGAKLADYDRSYQSGAEFGVNNTVVIKITPPAGFKFDRLSRIDLVPNFMGDSEKYVHLKLVTSLETLDTFWDSDVHLLPHMLSEPLQLTSAETIYAIFELQYVSGSGSDNYDINTTPYMRGLGLTYSVTEVS